MTTTPTPTGEPTTVDTAPVSELAQASTQVLDGDRSVDPELAALCRQAAAEGSVLLRNDGALPLAPGADVAVLGRVQVDWFTAGYGSGGDVNAPYATTLLDSLEAAGTVRVDAELAATYRQWCAAHVPPAGEWGSWPRSYEEMPLTDDAVAAAATRCPTAVVVIGRAAGEDRENTLEPGSYYLTEDERHLLEQATDAFERTVVVVNTGNVMDLAWAEELGVSALLLAWPGGMEGGRAVADVLTGAVEPGGRLSDSIAHRYEDHPSASSFGGTEFNDYVEDVYVGYRYFETFAPDAVAYPFGFGLGYTTIAVEPTGLTTPTPTTAGDDGAAGQQVTVTVRATNTGTRPGSTVVQVYSGSPEPGAATGTDGTAPAEVVPAGSGRALPRPARELLAFARTGEIEPGASRDLTLSFPLAHLASFDDSGATGHRDAWVLQAGSYPVLVGTNVRDVVRAGTVAVGRTEVTEQLEEALAPAAEHPFQRMTLAPTDGRTEAGAACAVVGWEDAPTATVDLRQRIVARLPEAVTGVEAGGVTFADVAEGRAGLDALLATMTPAQLADLSFGDITMDSPLGAPGNAGALGGVTEELRALGVPPAITTDGPSGIRVSAYASLLPCGTGLACTWDVPLVEELYTRHGAEMVRKGSDILLAPGMNIHRNPLCGRNFEYFSEDPLLTGLTAAAVVRGIQSNGVAACPKHLAANNQETARWICDSRISQRALREIYLRGFRLCVEQSHPKVIMTSYNKVNGQWSHYNYDLVTTILRGEWGYEGLVITDWWMRYAPDPLFPALRDSATRVRAQVDVLMPGAAEWSATHDDGHDDAVLAGLAAGEGQPEGEGLTLGEVQRTARNVLRFLLTSRTTAGA